MVTEVYKTPEKKKQYYYYKLGNMSLSLFVNDLSSWMTCRYDLLAPDMSYLFYCHSWLPMLENCMARET